MSSRALRKLQKNDQLAELSKNSDTDSDDDMPKKSAMPVNPFDLLEDEESDGIIDEEVPEPKENIPAKPTNSQKKKKKKKKKNKKVETEQIQNEDEDEIEASVRQVNAILGELPQPAGGSASAEELASSAAWTRLQPLLTVETKFLNPHTEMKKRFGSQVVMQEGRVRRNAHRVHRKSYVLIQPKDTWLPMTKTGLSMELEEIKGGCQYFRIEHNKDYRQVQFQFWDAVDSLNPQNIVNVLNTQPHHIDSLLQLSEVCKISEDVQTAMDLIERCLFCFESSFHPLFNVTQGNCRLDYKRAENRAFYIALFRHISFIGNRGCYRTALELSKLLLSLDPDGDPLGVLLMLDFYALRCEEYSYLVRMYYDWESDRNLTQLPNFAFSIPLAIFLQAFEKGEDSQKADEMLQNALLMFPGVLMPLIDKLGISPDSEVMSHSFFGHESQNSETEALQQLVALYIGRCHSCWKAPEVIQWLERNVKSTLARVNSGDPLVEQYKEKRSVRYQGTPRNIQRHILIAEVKEATTRLPPEIAHQPVLSYDPLPPNDSLQSYERPNRPRLVNQDASALSMFFRSLLPNFNPQEIVDAGAVGGAGEGPPADLRQGINHLMDAMRDLLNNIQPVPPPVENQDHEDEIEPGEWD